MVKRKSFSPSPDFLKAVGFGCFFLLVSGLSALTVLWCVRSLSGASLFSVKDVVVADHIERIGLSEFQKLKGQNIFQVDLGKVEAKIRSRYPQLAEVRVLRRFPDQIFVTAVQREAFVRVAVGAHMYVIDRHGYVIGTPRQEQKDLVVIKGVKRQKASAGEQIRDPWLTLALGIVSDFQKDGQLASSGLEAVDVEDPARIVCDLGTEDVAYKLIIDKEHVAEKLKMFASILGRGGLDLAGIKYIDLRFGEPVIGQKKAKK